MRILITTTQVPFCYGGAEMLAESLKNAFLEEGHEAEIVAIPFRWYPPEEILDHLLACRMLDIRESNGVPIDLVVGLKFPAYHIKHPNKVLWILHQHRSAFDLWENTGNDMAAFPGGDKIKQGIGHLEMQLLLEAKRIHTLSSNVSRRLEKYSRISAPHLYPPPPQAESFYCEDAEDYIYYPSRLEVLKRHDLVIRALACTKKPVKIYFSGRPIKPEFLNDLKSLAEELKVSDRISWFDWISDEEKQRKYARSRAVLFTPLDEDYGYVTLEAMLSSKAVVTCSDSGGPLEFINHEVNGLVAEPTPESLGERLDEIWGDPGFAIKAGRLGNEKYHSLNLSWKHVVQTLTQ